MGVHQGSYRGVGYPVMRGLAGMRERSHLIQIGGIVIHDEKTQLMNQTTRERECFVIIECMWKTELAFSYDH